MPGLVCTEFFATEKAALFCSMSKYYPPTQS